MFPARVLTPLTSNVVVSVSPATVNCPFERVSKSESASIPIPVVNVGERQKGRAQSGNVIFCGTKIAQIKTATKKAISKSYIDQIKNIENIYGDGKSAQRAMKILKDLKFDYILSKTEHPMDIPL